MRRWKWVLLRLPHPFSFRRFYEHLSYDSGLYACMNRFSAGEKGSVKVLQGIGKILHAVQFAFLSGFDMDALSAFI